jgi:hypothetical protein
VRIERELPTNFRGRIVISMGATAKSEDFYEYYCVLGLEGDGIQTKTMFGIECDKSEFHQAHGNEQR